MDLILWRHAKAEHAQNDLSRPLSTDGRKDALLMAEFLRNKLPKNMLCFASEAIRAQETLQTLDKPFQIADELNPEANLVQVLPWLMQQLQENNTSILCVGHQPWLGYVCAQLLSNQSSLDYPNFELNISRGALYWFDISVHSQLNKIHYQFKASLSPNILRREFHEP